MNGEVDTFAYMMAAEKMCNLLYTIENTMEFMNEYGIKADDEVKKALLPMLEQMKEWAK